MFAHRRVFVAVCFLLAVFPGLGLSAATEGTVQAQAAESAKSPRQRAWEERVPENFRNGEAFAYVEEDPALPRVLLIGDSISIGYTPAVRKELAGVANVLRIPENAGPTTRGLENIERWLGDTQWDVIHFNWGLHDLKRLNEAGKMDSNAPPQVPPRAYKRNLKELVKRLKETNAKLIWASTTPVPEGASGRLKGDDVTYNEIAARVMKRQDVGINDLYACVLPELEKLQRPKNVHFTDEGSEFLGAKVAAEIRKALRQNGARQPE